MANTRQYFIKAYSGGWQSVHFLENQQASAQQHQAPVASLKHNSWTSSYIRDECGSRLRKHAESLTRGGFPLSAAPRPVQHISCFPGALGSCGRVRERAGCNHINATSACSGGAQPSPWQQSKVLEPQHHNSLPNTFICIHSSHLVWHCTVKLWQTSLL